MPLASMTGFARIDGTAGPYAFAWELRSVNGKSLDLRLRVPPGFEAIEPQVRPQLQGRLVRGTVHASLAARRQQSDSEVRINEDVLAAVLATARDLSARLGAAPPTVDGLLALRGVIEVVERSEGEDEHRAIEAAMVEGFARALDALAAARGEEGAAIAAVVAGHVDEIARLAAEVEAAPARRPEAIRARLAEQVKLLLDAGTFDGDRLHQEAVLLAAKADVREELDRLKAHVEQARRLMAEGGAVGRKLDFLAQEFSREANTLCAKANDVAITQIGLALKHAVDQFREQVQNLE